MRTISILKAHTNLTDSQFYVIVRTCNIRITRTTNIMPRKKDIRGNIRAQELIDLLHDNAMGKIELDPTQVRSIELLLKKSLPDLKTSETIKVEDKANSRTIFLIK